MATVELEKLGPGNYRTKDGRWKVERDPYSGTPRWTVWDNQSETHAEGDPFGFDTKAAAVDWLSKRI